jgi:hypothetical protein
MALRGRINEFNLMGILFSVGVRAVDCIPTILVLLIPVSAELLTKTPGSTMISFGLMDLA